MFVYYVVLGIIILIIFFIHGSELINLYYFILLILKCFCTKLWKAQQIHSLINTENFLQHLNLVDIPGWTKVNYSDLDTQYKFPALPYNKFEQLAEISHGIHCIKKGMVLVFLYLKSYVVLTLLLFNLRFKNNF